MDAKALPRLIDRLPPIGAGIAGLAVAAAAALIPTATLEGLVWTTGIAALVPVAAPPLGLTARAVLALGGGVVAAAVAWAVLFLAFGPGGFLTRGVGTERDMPQVRRADAHPDAPPRRPFSAGDLVPAPPAERDLPQDLDQPLAAFDPAAVPPVPRTPSPALPPLARAPALVEGERIETFDLSPREPRDDEPTIEQLLHRLERGARVAAGR